jgi:hypothetical protein
MPSILALPRNASTPNADKTRHSFGNADRVLSFYLTAQCRNTEKFLNSPGYKHCFGYLTDPN